MVSPARTDAKERSAADAGAAANKLTDSAENETAAGTPAASAPGSGAAPKKDSKAAAKEQRRLQREAELEAQQAAIANVRVASIDDGNYGYLPLCNSKVVTGRTFTRIENLDASIGKKEVWLRCRVQESRCKGALGFLVLRERIATVQAVLNASAVGKEGVKWTGTIPLESVVDVRGVVEIPAAPIDSTTQKVEVHVSKIFCISKSAPTLPFQLRDAMQRDAVSAGGGVDAGGAADSEGVIVVHQDTRLDNRILDLRTVTNQAIFRIQSAVCRFWREALQERAFTEIHTPKLLGGASESGATVFTLDYFGRRACLAQSPQLHKQMAICGDLDRVFEIGPVFRAENSNTHRHLCEFTGLDFEMTIKEHYDEILTVLDETMQYIFTHLNEKFAKEIAVVNNQHPATPFVWLPKMPRIPFAEGMQMLRDAKVPGIPDDLSAFDMSTEQEKTLGRLVFEKFGTHFYALTRYPLKVRPFYTMPDAEDPTLSNSYDIFMRGEEIVSGAQRIHDVPLLLERIRAWNIPVESVQAYVDAFGLGSYPHGGVGVGLERVVMLFLGLPNIRKTSMFPRDPKRLAP